VAARGHRAEVDAAVVQLRLETHAIAEERATGEWAGGIHRQHPHALPARAQLAHQPRRERALADARRSGDADAHRAALQTRHAVDQLIATRAIVLDDADRARQRARIMLGNCCDQPIDRQLSRLRAMTMRWISVVPS
jgi:hypothetical protein